VKGKKDGPIFWTESSTINIVLHYVIYFPRAGGGCNRESASGRDISIFNHWWSKRDPRAKWVWVG